jgi:hypothetical protein
MQMLPFPFKLVARRPSLASSVVSEGNKSERGFGTTASKNHKMEGFPADICSVELYTIVTYSH